MITGPIWRSSRWTGTRSPGRTIVFSSAKLGRSDNLLTGQDVMAIGTPFGLNRTVTLGQISNNERCFYPERMTIDMTQEENLETGDFSNWVQMDTPINPGNSGGPLVDLNGEVVGINTRGGGQNLNFAIPIDTAKPVIAAILKSALPNKKGHVERSDLGIDFKPLQELESFYNVDINQGVLVNSVDRNGAAQKAGLRSQDILLAVNGTPHQLPISGGNRGGTEEDCRSAGRIQRRSVRQARQAEPAFAGQNPSPAKRVRRTKGTESLGPERA